MALADYGDKQNDTGIWHTVGEDPESGEDIRLRIRSMTDDVADDHRKKFQERKKRDGQWVDVPLTNEQRGELGWYNLGWMWTEVEGLAVGLKDDEAVSFYSKELGSAPYVLQVKTGKGEKAKWSRKESKDPLKKGDRVYLDGRLTQAIKRHVMEHYGIIARTVSEVNRDLQADFSKWAGEAQENL